MGKALRFTIPIAAVAATLAAAAGLASGQSTTGPMWATVNACTPTEAGMRASLPGDGSGAQMEVRFTAQYYSHAQGGWLPVAGAATSPWLSAGSAEYEWGQAGWTFTFTRPAPGTNFLIRGLAEMRWTEGGQVVRTASRVTSSAAGRGSCLFQG
jgi:hypothetical protein